MSLPSLVVASLLFAIGGLYMKYSEGLTKGPASAAVFGCFLAGAALQAIGMRRQQMGTAYTLVLGLEAVAAVGLGYVFLGERISFGKLGAIALIVSGIVWLERA